MSAQDIMAELPKLGAADIRLVKTKVDELIGVMTAGGMGQGNPSGSANKESLTAFLLRVAGTAKGLPSDLAENHDHYLYGTPKRVH